MKPLDDDVVRLVIAAREVAFVSTDRDAIKELDAASEAFADRVPWEDEPDESVGRENGWWKSVGIDLGLRPLHWRLEFDTATHCCFGSIGPVIFWLGW